MPEISMTKTKTILAISFAAIFAISMIMSPVYAGGHLFFEKSQVTIHEKKGTIDIKAKVTAKIPKDESGASGWALLGWEKVLVLVTHVPAFDDSVFDDKKGAFHTHVLSLLDGPTAFCDTDAEVDLIADITDPGYKNKVKKDKFSIKKVPLADLGASTGGGPVLAGIALSVVPDVGVPSGIHLCVDVVDVSIPKVKLKK